MLLYAPHNHILFTQLGLGFSFLPNIFRTSDMPNWEWGCQIKMPNCQLRNVIKKLLIFILLQFVTAFRAFTYINQRKCYNFTNKYTKSILLVVLTKTAIHQNKNIFKYIWDFGIVELWISSMKCIHPPRTHIVSSVQPQKIILTRRKHQLGQSNLILIMLKSVLVRKREWIEMTYML